MPSALWVIVPAAGKGVRLGADIAKQYMPILNTSILQHTLNKLLELPAEKILLVLDKNDKCFEQLHIEHPRKHLLERIDGGSERNYSVCNALRSLRLQADAKDWVLIHDAVRPCVVLSDIEKLLKNAEKNTDSAGVILATPVRDTLKKVHQQVIEKTLDRDALWCAQTPQLFRFGMLLNAVERALAEKQHWTDEAMVMELQGHKIAICPGRHDNIKITTPEDLQLAEFILRQQRGEICV